MSTTDTNPNNTRLINGEVSDAAEAMWLHAKSLEAEADNADVAFAESVEGHAGDYSKNLRSEAAKILALRDAYLNAIKVPQAEIEAAKEVFFDQLASTRLFLAHALREQNWSVLAI